jgi:hypothetical protein
VCRPVFFSLDNWESDERLCRVLIPEPKAKIPRHVAHQAAGDELTAKLLADPRDRHVVHQRLRPV